VEPVSFIAQWTEQAQPNEMVEKDEDYGQATDHVLNTCFLQYTQPSGFTVQQQGSGYQNNTQTFSEYVARLVEHIVLSSCHTQLT
jgi:hypothetical protein